MLMSTAPWLPKCSTLLASIFLLQWLRSNKEKLNLKDFKRENIGHDPRLYSKLRAEEDIIKEKKILGNTENVDDILEELSPSDVRTIIRSEDELTQANVWTRIFPTPTAINTYSFSLLLATLTSSWMPGSRSLDLAEAKVT